MDRTDAALALDVLRRHPEKIVPLRRESANMRALRRFVETRRDLVQDRVHVTNSFWARAFYESHKAKGASHNATIRALAFKWIRVQFRCWVDRVPYDESRYLSALQKRHSPILKFAAQSTS